MNNNWHQVFVYGTLMQSANTIRSLNKFGEHAEFVACSVTESASYTMHNLGYFPGVELSGTDKVCLLYTSPSPRDVEESRMPSSA